MALGARYGRREARYTKLLMMAPGFACGQLRGLEKHVWNRRSDR